MRFPPQARCFITGAAGGLGREFALALARDKGARLWLADINSDGAQATAKLALDAGASEAHALRCDVTKEEDLRAAARQVQDAAGGTDLLINNAGVAAAGRFTDIPAADWDWCLRINLSGVVSGCRAFLPMMKSQGSGGILNIASAAGLLCPPGLSPYNAAKAAVIAFSESLRAELSGAGIGVSVACPMFFPTGIFKAARVTGSDLARAQPLIDRSMKTSAAEIARRCLRGVEKDRFYILPTADVKALWALKRASPGLFRVFMVAAARRRLGLAV